MENGHSVHTGSAAQAFDIHIPISCIRRSVRGGDQRQKDIDQHSAHQGAERCGRGAADGEPGFLYTVKCRFKAHKHPWGKHGHIHNLDALWSAGRESGRCHPTQAKAGQHDKEQRCDGGEVDYCSRCSHGCCRLSGVADEKAEQSLQNDRCQHLAKPDVIARKMVMEAPLQHVAKQIPANEDERSGVCPQQREVCQRQRPYGKKGVVLAQQGFRIFIWPPLRVPR